MIMKFVFATAFACLAFVAISQDAIAQGKKKEGAGMTCAQRCSKYCEGRHQNCFDRCSTLRCAGR